MLTAGTVHFWIFVITTSLCLSLFMAWSIRPAIERIGATVGRKEMIGHHPKHYKIMGVASCVGIVLIFGIFPIYKASSYTVETTGLKDQFKIETDLDRVSDCMIASIKAKTFS